MRLKDFCKKKIAILDGEAALRRLQWNKHLKKNEKVCHVNDWRKKNLNKENIKCKGFDGSMSEMFQESKEATMTIVEWEREKWKELGLERH